MNAILKIELHVVMTKIHFLSLDQVTMKINFNQAEGNFDGLYIFTASTTERLVLQPQIFFSRKKSCTKIA